MSGSGFLIAATSSNSGKTTFAMGLIRALRNRGITVLPAKCGPDYIDPAFHHAASGNTCVNLDGWAMGDPRLQALAAGDGLRVIEGAMGLFDGGRDGRGSSADLAKRLNLPVILLVDCKAMSQSVGALVSGFLSFDKEVNIKGIVLNQVGSDRHELLLRASLQSIPVPIMGVIRRNKALARPSRHLGLVQAGEDKDLEAFLQRASKLIEQAVDVDAISEIARPLPDEGRQHGLAPMGSHIAIAKDACFSFIYPHLLSDWRDCGAKLSFFSPLKNEPPNPLADAIYLPGGYPELHAPALTRAGYFRKRMREAAQKGVKIYGECGGYMVLGHSITDKRDISHPMLGLLDLETSFSRPKFHLGYRHLSSTSGAYQGSFRGHEFHYASIITQEGQPMFEARNAMDEKLDPMGLVSGSVSGSFAHIIDLA